MSIPIKIVMETEQVDRFTLLSDKIVLGWAELDDTAGSPFGLAQLPGILHEIADQLESGMTSGPDESTWLADAPEGS